VLAHLCDAAKAQPLVQRLPFGGRMEQDVAPPDVAQQGFHQAPADALTLQGGRNDDEAERGPVVAPQPAQRGPDNPSVALGDDAGAVRERKSPVFQAVRPIQLGRQGLRGFEITGLQRAQANIARHGGHDCRIVVCSAIKSK
jgi:hypothetical protein